MPAIDFPNSPELNDLFTVGLRTWKWNGTFWESVGTTGPTGPTGPSGPSGPEGQSFANMDGGKSGTLYGGIEPIAGGTSGSF
jgi:hypothetical protein